MGKEGLNEKVQNYERPDSKTIEAVVEAENEDQAFEFWVNDVEERIISESTIEHDDGFLDIEEE